MLNGGINIYGKAGENMSNEPKYQVYMSTKVLAEIIGCCNALGMGLKAEMVPIGTNGNNALIVTTCGRVVVSNKMQTK